jgi:hypothetical protein
VDGEVGVEFSVVEGATDDFTSFDVTTVGGTI